MGALDVVGRNQGEQRVPADAIVVVARVRALRADEERIGRVLIEGAFDEERRRAEVVLETDAAIAFGGIGETEPDDGLVVRAQVAAGGLAA